MIKDSYLLALGGSHFLSVLPYDVSFSNRANIDGDGEFFDGISGQWLFSLFTVKGLIKLNRAAYFIKSYTDCYEKNNRIFE